MKNLNLKIVGSLVTLIALVFGFQNCGSQMALSEYQVLSESDGMTEFEVMVDQDAHSLNLKIPQQSDSEESEVDSEEVERVIQWFYIDEDGNQFDFDSQSENLNVFDIDMVLMAAGEIHAKITTGDTVKVLKFRLKIEKNDSKVTSDRVIGLPSRDPRPVIGLPAPVVNPVIGMPAPIVDPVIGLPSRDRDPVIGTPAPVGLRVIGLPARKPVKRPKPVIGMQVKKPQPVIGLPSRDRDPVIGLPAPVGLRVIGLPAKDKKIKDKPKKVVGLPPMKKKTEKKSKKVIGLPAPKE